MVNPSISLISSYTLANNFCECFLRTLLIHTSNHFVFNYQLKQLFFFLLTDQSIFGNVQPVVGARESNLVKTYKASTVVQCLLRCSRITECKSAAIEEISNSRSSTGYCQLYRALFKTSIGDGVYFQNKQYYNIKKKVV